MTASRLATLWLAALVITAAQARAQRQRPAAEDEVADEQRFWMRALHPNRASYRELVKQAAPMVASRPADAAPLLERAARLEPDLPEAHHLLALAYHAEGRFADCAAQISRAHQLDPTYRAPGEPAGREHHVRATCLAHSGRPEDAILEYRTALASEYARAAARRAELLHGLADAYQALGRLEEAIPEYRRAIEAAPQQVAPRCMLAVAFDRDGQTAQAQDEVREALRVDPSAGLVELGRARFLPAEDEDYCRGFAHEVAGRRSLAIVHFRRYLARGATAPWTRRGGEHLAVLGAARLEDADIQIKGHGTLDRMAVVRPLLAAAGDLQGCVAGHPQLRVSVRITLLPRTTVARDDPVWAASDGPGASPPEVVSCVAAQARRVSLPAPVGAPVSVEFAVIAP